MEVSPGRPSWAEGQPGQRLQDRTLARVRLSESLGSWHRVFWWRGRDKSLVLWLLKRMRMNVGIS